MKTIVKQILTLAVTLSAFLALSHSCTNVPEIPDDILLSKISVSAYVSEVGITSATLIGTSAYLAKIKSGGFYYGTTDPPTTSASASISGSSFTTTINGLTPATTYYYCAFIKGFKDEKESSVGSFTTSEPPKGPYCNYHFSFFDNTL